MSITSSRNEKFFGPFMYGVSFVPSPNRYRNDFGIEGEEGDLRCAEAIEQEILAQGPDRVAAVTGEPVSVSNSNLSHRRVIGNGCGKPAMRMAYC